MIVTKKPHYDKLQAALENEKLPKEDKPLVEEAIKKYNKWITDLSECKKLDSPENVLKKMVQLFNEYKFFIEYNLIFECKNDFLYRQKGQLKLDNSIIEEFLPYIICPEVIPEISGNSLEVGPTNTFSSIYFTSSLDNLVNGGGLKIRSKDQDFAISKPLYIMSSFDKDFKDKSISFTNLAYIVAECKTNLDKTMFQEASATAHDVKTAVPGAKYFLLCEWLDMTPISTAPTDIDEVIILRKAKRISSNKRAEFNESKNRELVKEDYKKFLLDNPISYEMILRFIEHIKKVINRESLVEDDVLQNGYF